MPRETVGPRQLALAALLLLCAIESAGAQNVPTKVEVARPQPANIRVEVLLADKVEGKTIAEERLTMLLANETEGRLRRDLPDKLPSANRALQVDLRANLAGDRVKLFLTLQYNAPLSPEAGGAQVESIGFVQMASSFLDPGKPTVMIDAVGGPGNRRVTVQATATIVR
jgi:hypothetical protein